MAHSPQRSAAARRHGLAQRLRLAIAHGRCPPLWPPAPLGRALLACLSMAGRLLRSLPAMPFVRFPAAYLAHPEAWPHGARACLSGMLRPFLLLGFPTRAGQLLCCCRRPMPPRRATVTRRGVAGGGGSFAGGRGRGWKTSAKRWQNDCNYFFATKCYNGSFAGACGRAPDFLPIDTGIAAYAE